MKEKKKKRKSWMNRIVAFLTTVCLACVTFVVPAFAEETTVSSFGYTYINKLDDSSCVHKLDATFTSDDVTAFLFTYGESTIDNNGNIVTTLYPKISFVSKEAFSGSALYTRDVHASGWHDEKSTKLNSYPLDDSEYYIAGISSIFIAQLVNDVSYAGKFVRFHLPNRSFSDKNLILDYLNGNDEYVVESDLTGQLDSDIDSIGYLKDVKVNVLGVEGKEYFAITYGSLTTSDYDLANSNIQYQVRSRYYTTMGLCDLDNVTDIESFPANLYKLTFDKEELIAPIQQCIYDKIIYPTAGDGEPNFFEDHMIFQYLHSSDAFSFVEIYMRPTGFVNNQECVGGWTKIHIELAQDGSYTTDTYLISTGTNDSYQIIAGLDDEWNDVTPPSKNNPDYGTGSTIDSALNNIPSVDNAFSFDLSGVDDIGSYFENLLKSLLQSIGSVPTMIKTCFSFLPNEIILFLGGGLVLIVILRIFGR